MSTASRYRALLCAIVALATLAGAASYATSFRMGLAALRSTAHDRAGLYAGMLEQAVSRHAYLPDVLAADLRLRTLLARPTDAASRAEANAWLEEIAEASGAADLYLLDASGVAIAASNHREALSFVGHDYSFRPYFVDAMREGSGRFYGVGVTTGTPGYFLARRVGTAAKPLGVAVAKLALGPLEARWSVGGEDVLVADGYGVAFLTSRAAWRYRPLAPLGPGALAGIAEAAQYRGLDLARPPPFAPSTDASIVTIEEPGTGANETRLRAVASSAPEGWTVHVLASTRELEREAALAGVVGFLAALASGLGALAWRSRRQAHRAALTSRDQLESLVRARTAELSAANQELENEIAQRRATEDVLRRTRDDLVHASKLSALGHMSAAVAHEVNQPLSALRTYIASTMRLHRDGQGGAVADNLGRMAELVARLGTLTSDLKLFARKDPGRLERIDVRDVLARALALADPQLREAGACLRTGGLEAPVLVEAAASRLEQVFLNLLINAADAVRGAPVRRIVMDLREDDGAVRVTISDTGSGIRAEDRDRVFDPFFTTKEVGEGMGLGLSISQAIVAGFGGTISVESRTPGAAFTVSLPPAAPAAPLLSLARAS